MSTSNPFSNLQATLDRQLAYTEIMCAGMNDREFKEKDVTRNKGQFATKEEKAAKAKEIADANKAAMDSAAPGVFKMPDGSEAYKFNPKQEKALANYAAEMKALTAPLAALAATDPVKAASFGQQIEAQRQLALKDLQLSDKALDKYDTDRKKMVMSEVYKKLGDVLAPVKAAAVAQITKSVATNMSADEVRKGMVEVSKKLNSGEPSKPADITQMLKNFAAQAQANLEKNIKQAQTVDAEAKAKALAAGMGLMTKISEIANNPLLKELGSAAALGFTAGLIPRLAGGAIGGAIGGPAGVVVGSTIGSVAGGVFNGANIVKGLTSFDPQYYTKEVEAIGRAVGNGYNALTNGGGNPKDKIAKPTDAKPSVAKPTVAKPTVAKPTVAKPTVAKPTVAKPTVAKPTKDGAQMVKDTLLEGKKVAQSQLKKLGDEANNLKDKVAKSTAESTKGGAQMVRDTLLNRQEADIKPKYQIGDTAASIGKNIERLKTDTAASIGKNIENLKSGTAATAASIGKNVGQLKTDTISAVDHVAKKAAKALPSKDEVVGAYRDLARGATSTGLPASIVGGVGGGFLGGSIGGPAGYVAGVEIGRDLGGLAGTAAGAIKSFTERNGKKSLDRDTSEPGINKIGRAVNKLGTDLPGLASQARSQGIDAISKLADGAKNTLANRQLDPSEPGIYGAGRAASAAVNKATTAAGQKVSQIAEANAASRVIQSDVLKAAQLRAKASAASERGNIARSSAAVEFPGQNIVKKRNDTNPAAEGLTALTKGIETNFAKLSKLIPISSPSPAAAAARTRSAAAARNEKLKIDTAALNRVSQATVKQRTFQKTARENAEKAAKTQRLTQQAQALKQLNDRLAKV